MTDDDNDLGGGPDAPVPFARSYDFFKHMTGIALLSIGGVFAFLDGAATSPDRLKYAMVLGFLGLSGVTSLIMASTLASVETKPIPHAKLARQVRIGQGVAVFFLSVGLGVFMPTFASGMLK